MIASETWMNHLPAIFVVDKLTLAIQYHNQKAKELIDANPDIFHDIRTMLRYDNQIMQLQNCAYLVHIAKDEKQYEILLQDYASFIPYKQLLDDAEVGICRFSFHQDGIQLEYANEFIQNMLGYTDYETAGNTIIMLDDIIGKEEYQRIRKRLIRQLTTTSFAQTHEELVLYDVHGNIHHSDVHIIVQQETKLMAYVSVKDKTKEMQDMQRLRMMEERYQIAFTNTSTCVWEYDVMRHTISQNGAGKCFGISGDIIENVPASLLENKQIHPEYADEFCQLFKSIHAGEKHTEWVGKIIDGEQHYAWIKIVCTTILDDEGNVVRAIGINENVNEIVRTRMLYEQEMQYRKAMIEGCLTAFEVDLTDDCFLDGRAYKTGWLYEAGVRFNQRYSEFVSTRVDIDLCDEDFLTYISMLDRDALLQAFQDEKHELTCTYRILNNEQQFFWVEAITHLIQNPANEHILAFICVRDIHEEKEKELALIQQAHHDALTGLYNRVTFEKKLKEKLKTMQLQILPAALCMIDVDDFKHVNDTYGHRCGDFLLNEISTRLLRVVNQDGMVARLGGDEFLCSFDKAGTRGYMELLGEHLRHVLRVPIQFEGQSITPTVSIGIVVYSKCVSYDELYHLVDEEMYKAKKLGKNGYSIFVL